MLQKKFSLLIFFEVYIRLTGFKIVLYAITYLFHSYAKLEWALFMVSLLSVCSLFSVDV